MAMEQNNMEQLMNTMMTPDQLVELNMQVTLEMYNKWVIAF